MIIKETGIEHLVPSPNGCLIWKWATNTKGYPIQWYDGRPMYLTRLLLARDITHYNDKSWLAMHTCDNPKCVNIKHLRIGSASDNQMDSVRKGRHWESRKTHCKNGHEYSISNTRISIKGKRNCKICEKDYDKLRSKISAFNRKQRRRGGTADSSLLKSDSLKESVGAIPTGGTNDIRN